ncbi:MAG: MerR family transcriptional regulator [Actinomycetota bacterium]
MHIGEVAERTSLSLRTLRHYDDIDLVTPSGRTEGGFRLYTEADVARIMLIRRMKPLGYSLDEMRDVLSVFDAVTKGETGADTTGDALAGIRAAAEERRARLVEQVAMADEFLAQLAGL